MITCLKSRHARIVQTIHDVGIPTNFYKKYDASFAISDAVLDDVRRRSSLPGRKVYNGIPIELSHRRKSYFLNEGDTVKLVQVSRLFHEKKGQDILLKAMHLVIYKFGFCNIFLDFIGLGYSLDYLKALVTELNLERHVNFLGERTRNWLFSNLAEYHILVQPSRYEGFGLTVLEGLAAGLPVLVSDIDGPREILSNVPGGYVFKAGDETECAIALVKIFDRYRNDKIGGMIINTIAILQKTYSLEACTQGYLREYYLLV